jgi:hypothetical protein
MDITIVRIAIITANVYMHTAPVITIALTTEVITGTGKKNFLLQANKQQGPGSPGLSHFIRYA